MMFLFIDFVELNIYSQGLCNTAKFILCAVVYILSDIEIWKLSVTSSNLKCLDLIHRLNQTLLVPSL